MRISLKSIGLFLIVAIICYVAYFLYGILRYSHSLDQQIHKQYMCFFKDSIRNHIDTSFCYSYVNKKDVYNNFHYKKDTFNIILWEFTGLKFKRLTNIHFNESVPLDEINFRSGEILNKKSDLEITIKYGYAFPNIMNVNLDNQSVIEKSIEGTTTSGFYGSIKKMSLGNDKNEHQILFSYPENPKPTMALFYQGQKNLYLIIINSDNAFDESIINILNLNNPNN